MDGRMDGKSTYSTGLCSLSGPLQPENSIKQSKSTADHMMPLGDWLTIHPNLEVITLFFRVAYNFTKLHL